MAERQLPLPGPIVKKSNALVRASWSVKSVYEPRLVALVASRVRIDDKDFQDYEIPISELLGASSDGRTRQLVADVVDGLLGRVLTLPRANGWAKCNVFSCVEFDGKAGLIRARFDPSLKPHYLNLQSHFTEYALMEFLLLPSTYSQRLFEVLKSWSNLPEALISLSDLFSMLDVPDSLRRYPDFRRKVLERAHKDITCKTALRFEWEPIKKGRAVDSIRFTFGRRAVVTEEKKTSERKNKDGELKNRLLKDAVKCFRENGENCVSSESEQCKICLRLVKSAKPESTGIDSKISSNHKPLEKAVDKESTCKVNKDNALDHEVDKVFPDSDSLKKQMMECYSEHWREKCFFDKGEICDLCKESYPDSPHSDISKFRKLGLSYREASEIFFKLLNSGKLPEALEALPSLSVAYGQLPKKKKKKKTLSAFIISNLKSLFLNQ